MELFFLFALVAGGSLLMLDSDSEETAAVDPDADPDPDVQPEPEPEEESNRQIGIEGQDDLLIGGAGDDVLGGNMGDADHLSGGDGDDLLRFGAGNSANGGDGSDLFILRGYGDAETVIEDFDLTEDELRMRASSHHDLKMYPTEDGTGVRFVDTYLKRTLLTLDGVTLEEGETIEVDLISSSGNVTDTLSFTGPVVGTPHFTTDSIRSGAGDDTLTGTAGDDVIFGGDGTDTLMGGAGDDILYGGSHLVFDETSYHHFPGVVTAVGDDDDVLDGGAGDDRLHMGPGNTATGGEGDDTFYAYANTYAPGAAVAEITDFTPGEDQVVIDFPQTTSPLPRFLFDDAIDAFSMTYDADQDQTTVTLNGEDVVVINGDQTSASVAFRDLYYIDVDREWLDADGNQITEAEGNAADILLVGEHEMYVLGDNVNATPT